MKKRSLIAILLSTSMGFSMSTQAVETAPNPSQDPVIEHLKLSDEQVNQINVLHGQMEKDIKGISTGDIKKGALVDSIRAEAWNEKGVNEQLKAISDVESKARYYRVKYYFDMNKTLTPEQRKIIKDDLLQAATK